VEIHPGNRTPAGVMMLPVPGVGRLKWVNGVQEASQVHGIRDVFIMAKAGDTIRAFPEQGCYVGFIMAVGSNTKDVETSLNQSHALLHFELDPLDDGSAE